MKIKKTVKLTLLLLVAMLGVGTASAYFAFQVGHKALQGVNQPDTNPTKKLSDVSKSSTEPVEFKPVDEKIILTKVYDHIHQKGKSSSKPKPSEQKEASAKQEEKSASPSTDNSSQESSEKAADFPLKIQDQGVTLEVSEASQQGSTFSLKVNLKNEGSEAVKFLYSFLEVKDNQGRALSAITEGLPEELPPNSEDFTGTVKISSGLVNESETLSINLTDYPDQKLKLSLAKIPVVK